MGNIAYGTTVARGGGRQRLSSLHHSQPRGCPEGMRTKLRVSGCIISYKRPDRLLRVNRLRDFPVTKAQPASCRGANTLDQRRGRESIDERNGQRLTAPTPYNTGLLKGLHVVVAALNVNVGSDAED